jgi:hypothetical protein
MRFVTSKGLEEKPKNSKTFSEFRPVCVPFLNDSITDLLKCSPSSISSPSLAQSMTEIIVVVVVSYSNELKLTDRYNNYI